MLGFEHGKVGQLLLQEWKLPTPIINAVGNHHKPMRSRVHALESSVIHIADILVNGLQLGSSSGISTVAPLNEKAWDLVGLSSALIPNMLEHVESQYHDAIDVFLS